MLDHVSLRKENGEEQKENSCEIALTPYQGEIPQGGGVECDFVDKLGS